jgi:ABC-type transport system involved in cytochrome c biogenesis permease subunit
MLDLSQTLFWLSLVSALAATLVYGTLTVRVNLAVMSMSGQTAAGSMPVPRRADGRTNTLGLAATGSALLTTLLLGGSILTRWIEIGHIPLSNMFEATVGLAWATCVAHLAFEYGTGARRAGVIALLYLLRARYDDRTAARAAVRFPVTLGRALPGSASLDRAAYVVIAFAFPIWTFAIIAGGIWAEAAWGRYWGWDPKETWSFITWVLYAGYLHARATAGWKGRKAAWVAVAAAAALIVDYYVVNIFVVGLHSYA